MYGLTVRWSLRSAPDDVADTLRRYVRDESLARFSGMPGLRFKTWRMVPGEWFEGTYVWATPQARADFLTRFQAGAADAPGTRIIGTEPAEYTEFEVVAVAEGASRFAAGPGPQAASACGGRGPGPAGGWRGFWVAPAAGTAGLATDVAAATGASAATPRPATLATPVTLWPRERRK